jgi:uncharacterized protein (TIGR00255 family)
MKTYKLHSMTGYGRGVVRGPIACEVEIKTTNHRFCDIQLRMENSLASMEAEVRKKIQSCIARGRVEVQVSCEHREMQLHFDDALAAQYYKLANRLTRQLKISKGSIDVIRLMELPGIVRTEEVRASGNRVRQVLVKSLDAALAGLVASRIAEGSRLCTDMARRTGRIARLVDRMRKLSPQVAEKYRKRLEKRLGKKSAGEDKARIDAEAAISAERSDITEEIVRISSHLIQAGKLMSQTGAVGRQLDFIAQEILREINTVSAKASDTRISRLTLNVREELEKIREQIQNIE